jgi:hypothetical protein
MKTGRIIVHYFLSFTLRLAVALGYAAGFNAMVFLPLHGARAQNAASQPASGGSEAAGITADELTTPATAASDAGAVLAQAQRFAQASNKAPGQTQTAAAKTGAATPDYAPPGGVAGLGQVDPSTGKLTFSGPIASVGGKTSPLFSLSVIAMAWCSPARSAEAACPPRIETLGTAMPMTARRG